MKTFIALSLLAFAQPIFGQGTDRWPIKTLTDGAALDTTVHHSTIAELTALSRPTGGWLNLPRQPQESVLTEVEGTITAVGKETDGDYHIVLSDGQQTMIIEIPDGTLTKSPYDPTWQSLRDLVATQVGSVGAIHSVTPFKVTVQGYPLFDKIGHGTGHATNGIELHPLVSIKLGSVSSVAAPSLRASAQSDFQGSISLSNLNSDRATVNISCSEPITGVRIVNQLGQVMLELTVNEPANTFSASLPISKFASGMYFVHAVCTSGYVARKFEVKR